LTLEPNLAWAEVSLGRRDDWLLHHYTMHVAHSFTFSGPIGRTWAEGIPQMALSDGYDYLTHALLAVSAAFRVLHGPNDINTGQLGIFHYGECLKLLGTLNFDDQSLNPCAALATTILLAWYEVLLPKGH
jgi:hypothetical protein